MRLLFISIFLLSSCTYVSNLFEEKDFDVIDANKDSLSLVFSHNINGETHPCGCRHFPLGGLPQVAGLLHKLQQDHQVLYIDSGDMLFPASTIPETLKTSLSFAATNLFQGLTDLDLLYFVPGDQDFAAGVDFLKKVPQDKSPSILLSNLKDPNSLPHKRWAKVQKDNHRLYLIGISSPVALPQPYNSLFKNPEESLEEIIKEIEKDGYDKNNKQHRLILISHAGMDEDKIYASAFPQIDWIIGSHSQSFTKFPFEQGKTKIVQVLSRNHYMGEIRFDLKKDKTADKFHQHEIGEGLAKELSPNPFIKFIEDHKKKLSQLQEQEQNALAGNFENQGIQPLKTSQSCLECHEDQGEHWQKTPHALGYITLFNANESNNTQCLKCHTLGLNEKEGFFRASDVVKFDPEVVKKEKLKAHQEAYWKKIKQAFGKIESVRALSSNELLAHSKAWHKIDEEMNVTHNFSNIQCLNCHEQDPEHPFNLNEEKGTRAQRVKSMQAKCLACHDPDQSPEWYTKDEKGLPKDVNQLVLDQHFKSMGCPIQKEEE